jgi:adenylyltransferase/sulfurtransferase
MSVGEISPVELKEKMERGEDLQLIDVREQSEWNANRIEGAVLHPMSRLQSSVGSIEKDREVVLYCRSGARSRRVGEWLVSQGYQKVFNLSGGIDAWHSEL